MKIKPFGSIPKFALCLEWEKKSRLALQKCQPLYATEQVLYLSVQDPGLLWTKSHTLPPFPITSNCFSFENRWILNSILAARVWIGLLEAECNILNPYERGKCPFACCVSGSHLESMTSCMATTVETSVSVIDRNTI